MFTLNGRVQPFIDIYLNQRTMDGVRNMFPYVVDTSKATGVSEEHAPLCMIGRKTNDVHAIAVFTPEQVAATCRAWSSMCWRTTRRRSRCAASRSSRCSVRLRAARCDARAAGCPI